MRSPFHRRLIAGIAVFALAFAMLGYAAHRHDAGDKSHNDTHCDLCLQLQAAAGSPGALQRFAPAVLVLYLLPVAGDGFRGASCLYRVHQPRAPPGLLAG
jgi:hypothetical protein